MGLLEELAARQGVWSATADKLKASLDRVRWIVLVLSVLGALSAAVASQVDSETPRLYFGAGAAVLLGVVAFLNLRLLRSDRTSIWVRARAASEALKREAFKFAAHAAPYDNAGTRVHRLNAERERIESDVDDLLDQAEMSGRSRILAVDIAPVEYVQTRVRAQVPDYYEPRAKAYRAAAVRLRWVEFGLALAATIITGAVAIVGKDPAGLGFDFIALTAVLTTLSGAILAHIEASRYDFLVTNYRATARRLRNELANLAVIPAAPSAEWSAFVDRCERIISEENNNWVAKWTKPAER